MTCRDEMTKFERNRTLALNDSMEIEVRKIRNWKVNAEYDLKVKQQRLENAGETIQALRSENRELKSLNKELEVLVEQTERQNEDNQRNVQSVQRRLQAAENHHEALKCSIREIESTRTDLHCIYDEICKDISLTNESFKLQEVQMTEQFDKLVKINQDLNDKDGKLTKEVKTLEQKLTDLQKSSSNFLQTKEAIIEELKAQLEDKASIIQNLQGQMERELSSGLETQGKLAAIEQQMTEMKAGYEKQLQETEAALLQMQQKNEVLSEQVTHSKEENLRLEAQIEELRSIIGTSEAMRKELAIHIEEKCQEAQNYAEENKNLNDQLLKLIQLESEHKALQQEFILNNNNLKNVNEELQRIVKEFDGIQSKYEEEVTRRKDVEQVLKEITEESAKKGTEITRLSGQVIDLQVELQDSKIELRSSGSRLELQMKENIMLKGSIDEKNAELRKLSEENDKMKITLESSKLEAHIKEANITSELDELQTESRLKFSRMEEQIKTLQKEKEETGNDNIKLKEIFLETEESCKNLTEQVDNIMKELSDLRFAHDGCQVTIDGLKQAVEEKKNEKDQLRWQLLAANDKMVEGLENTIQKLECEKQEAIAKISTLEETNKEIQAKLKLSEELEQECQKLTDETTRREKYDSDSSFYVLCKSDTDSEVPKRTNHLQKRTLVGSKAAESSLHNNGRKKRRLIDDGVESSATTNRSSTSRVQTPGSNSSRKPTSAGKFNKFFKSRNTPVSKRFQGETDDD